MISRSGPRRLPGIARAPWADPKDLFALFDVWAANNWNLPEAALGDTPINATSTWGGGSGFTVIYGVAAPVKPPRMGKVRGVLTNSLNNIRVPRGSFRLRSMTGKGQNA